MAGEFLRWKIHTYVDLETPHMIHRENILNSFYACAMSAQLSN